MADHAQKHRFFIVSGSLALRCRFSAARTDAESWALPGANAILRHGFLDVDFVHDFNSMYYEPHEFPASIGSINAFNNAGIPDRIYPKRAALRKYGMVMMFWLSLASGILGAAVWR